MRKLNFFTLIILYFGYFPSTLTQGLPFNEEPECLSNRITFVDSLGNEINSSHNNLDFILNKGTDTIKLEQLYNISLVGQTKMYPFSLAASRTDYCFKCLKREIKIIDSVDVNQDGVKEIILFREWHCSASPPGFHPYGVGTETEVSSQYEVWDIKFKKQLFKVKNRLSTSFTISTNVGYSEGYRFDVKVNKKGTFSLSNPSKENCGFEMGVYKYNNDKGEYIKE